MLGIQEIASFIPEGRVSNYSKKEAFNITSQFLEDKIGVGKIAIKDETDESSDLCVKAFENLVRKIDINPEDVDVLLVVTQNPDYNIPHCSAMVHGKLNVSEKCACFDISLGCSGYVYGLSVMQAFMRENDLSKGLLFTSDPYSKIIDPNDKNTSLLFGDAAAVTLISREPVFKTEKFTFGTIGKDYKELICRENKLYMNGRAVFNFAAKVLPPDIRNLLEKNNLTFDDVDKYIFHQGSKFIVDTLTKRLELPKEKVVFDIFDYGNTVSSSIPIILEKEIHNDSGLLLLSGFGVGLSWANAVLRRL